ncbi:MAG: respiratory nitrate reductase subunit gamma [Methanimicrococcus sp.]|nr:respiratory nitrate reductase subunit gamma [Methanimicrococcus sp.]
MAMEYFSGVAGVSLTFNVMMAVAFMAVFLLLVGFYFNIRKWSQGSEGWGLDPADGRKGNFMVFFKTYWKQLRSHSIHHEQNILETLVFDVLLLRRTARADPLRWFMHMLIFIGWMGLFSLSGLMFAVEMIYLVGFHYIDPEWFREFLQFPNQILGYVLLFGVIIAIARRLFIKKVKENTNSYDSILIVTLFIVVVTGFVAHAGRYIAFGITDFTGVDFIHYDYLFWTLGGMTPFLTYVKEIALTHSILALFIGFAFIPYSKYIHAVAAPLSMIVNKGGEH